MTDLELVIRYVGFGKICNSCGRVRKTTHYVLRQGDTLHQNLYLCDDCQDNGHVIRFRPIKEPVSGKKDRRKRVKMSQTLEKKLAVDLDGITHPGSGNKDEKGDIRVFGEWRIEHKFTTSVRSFILKVEDLVTIIRHANKAGEWPALIIDFRRLTRRFVVLPFEVFEQLRERARG
jgi:hypothetical protein